MLREKLNEVQIKSLITIRGSKSTKQMKSGMGGGGWALLRRLVMVWPFVARVHGFRRICEVVRRHSSQRNAAARHGAHLADGVGTAAQTHTRQASPASGRHARVRFLLLNIDGLRRCLGLVALLRVWLVSLRRRSAIASLSLVRVLGLLRIVATLLGRWSTLWWVIATLRLSADIRLVLGLSRVIIVLGTHFRKLWTDGGRGG